MIKPARNRFGPDAGAAAVEFALILPMLILMVIGIFEMGRMVYIRSILENAARSATQIAFTDPTATATIVAAAEAALTANGITDAVVIAPGQACECSDGTTIACSGAICAAGTVRHFVTVEITRTHTPMLNPVNLPFGLGVDFSMPMQGKSAMRVQ